jgi:hypothetical protein
LAAGAVEAGLNLPLGAPAVGTLMHVRRYNIISADLGNSLNFGEQHNIIPS